MVGWIDGVRDYVTVTDTVTDTDMVIDTVTDTITYKAVTFLFNLTDVAISRR
jgi:hypothetical protein